MIIIKDDGLNTVNIVIDKESGGIYVFVDDGINELGSRISLNPDYAEWLETNRGNLQALFELSTIYKDKHAWYISEGYYNSFVYRDELVNAITRLEYILSTVKN